jgi:hypothetical protein
MPESNAELAIAFLPVMIARAASMNPIRTFRPTVGAHVHDALNNVWMTLTADDVAEMERDTRKYGRERGIENWDGFVLDGWLPPEATPPPTIRTPGPGASQLAAIRVALSSGAMSDYMIGPEQLEAIIAEARGEGVAEAIALVEAADLPSGAREALLTRLRQL